MAPAPAIDAGGGAAGVDAAIWCSGVTIPCNAGGADGVVVAAGVAGVAGAGVAGVASAAGVAVAGVAAGPGVLLPLSFWNSL